MQSTLRIGCPTNGPRTCCIWTVHWIRRSKQRLGCFWKCVWFCCCDRSPLRWPTMSFWWTIIVRARISWDTIGHWSSNFALPRRKYLRRRWNMWSNERNRKITTKFECLFVLFDDDDYYQGKRSNLWRPHKIYLIIILFMNDACARIVVKCELSAVVAFVYKKIYIYFKLMYARNLFCYEQINYLYHFCWLMTYGNEDNNFKIYLYAFDQIHQRTR